MKNFKRSYPLFSLCGLNCGLCSMHLNNYCPGCGGGVGNQPCAIARCSQQRGGIEYCYLCEEYPCEKYNGIDVFDSFITHRNQLKDVEKVKESDNLTLKEKAALASNLFQTMAAKRNIVLKLYKKTSKKPGDTRADLLY